LAAPPPFSSLYLSRPHSDLHSFPTRRSSDLGSPGLVGSNPTLSADAAKTALDQAKSWSRAVRVSSGEVRLGPAQGGLFRPGGQIDRKSTRLNSSHVSISYAVFCLKKKK